MKTTSNKFAMRITRFAFIMLAIGSFAYAGHHMVKKEITNATSIKAYITSIKKALEKDTEQLPTLIKDTEKLLSRIEDIPTKAVLRSMQAEMYQQYYEQNRFAIRDRSEQAATPPERIQEWNKKQFDTAIDSLLTASLEPKDLLSQTPIDAFKEILTQETQTSTSPSLYAFLAQRAIDISPSNKRYETLLAYQHTLPSKEAAVLTHLDYLDFQSLPFEQKKASLDSLQSRYQDEAFVVEIIDRRLDYMYEDSDSAKTLKYNLCKETIARFPNYQRIALLKNTLAAMEQTRISFAINKQVYPQKEVSIILEHTNLSEALLSLVDKRSGKTVATHTFALKNDLPYVSYTETIRFIAPKVGEYTLAFSSPKKDISRKKTLHVSRLASTFRQVSDSYSEVWVTDYLSGKPIEHATIHPFGVKTDKQGIARIEHAKHKTPDTSHLNYKVVLGKDSYGTTTSSYISTDKDTNDEQNKAEKLNVQLFTDRKIYRPGQLIHFKGVVTAAKAESKMQAKAFTIILRDANQKEVATREVQTNSFGSFSGEIVIPKHRLMGDYTLETQTGEARTTVQVAAYKRPTFQIDFSPLEETRFGVALTIKGIAKQFAGTAVSKGKVHYRIVRRPFWLRSTTRFEETCLAEGNTLTDEKGTFAIPFTPESQANAPYATFYLELQITDSKGESQETQLLFSAGNKGLLLSSSLERMEEKEQLSFSVSAQTLNGTPATAKGTYQLFRLISDKQIDNPTYTLGSCLAQGTFESDKAVASETFRTLPSGNYRLRLHTEDKWKQEISHEQDFVLYSQTDKRPPITTHTWLATPKTQTLQVGETAAIRFGTSDTKTYLFYEVYTQAGFAKREVLRLSDEMKSFPVPFLASYGKEAIVSFSFVKAGELHTEEVRLLRKEPSKKLCIKPLSFRDKLTPGGKETWTFQVKTADSTAVPTEVLASMYDASLDNIAPFAWYWSTPATPRLSFPDLKKGESFDSHYVYAEQTLRTQDTPKLLSAQLDWQDAFASPNFELFEGDVSSLRMKSAGTQNRMMSNNDLLSLSTASAAEETEAATSETRNLREDFQETAFFYPHLQTNAAGEVQFGFTLPESNTTWKLQLLAHNTALQHGIHTAEVQSSKPLMLTPDRLRFVRRGDTVHFRAQIANESAESISGKAQIRLSRAQSEAGETPLFTGEQPFTLAAGEANTVSWSVPIPEGEELITCRIIADSEQCSDGEQYMIPVLSSDMQITEAQPFYLGTNQTKKQLTLAPLKGDAKTSLELSTNPIWYAIQALPTLSTPDNSSTTSLFAAYYSAQIGRHLMQRYPQIQAALRRAQTAEKTPDLLLSHLEKNEDLKSILLEETPWVLDAQNEKEQIQQLSLLFDLNRASDLTETTRTRLLEMQTADGGWGWYNSPYSSPYITQMILKGMANLTNLGAVSYNQAEKKMQAKALNYLDKYIQTYYESDTLRAQMLTEQVIDFLYMRQFYRDIPEQGEARTAIRHFTDLASQEWRKTSLRSKAQIALLMLSNGKEKISDDIFTWFRKTATVSADKGMYWANNRRRYSYDASPIETHVLLMSLFEKKGNEIEMDKMKQWLLQQKRTQLWESRPATLDAVYALLATGEQWIAAEGTCRVSDSKGKPINLQAETSGETGYSKTLIPTKANQQQTLLVQKDSKAPAWGAVYRQYTTPVSEVKASGNALRIRKEILNKGKELKVGDKVSIRLIVESKEELHYVHIKDQRAACFEPVKQLSGFVRQGYLWMATEPQDASENFFIERMPAGTHVIEYETYVGREGAYTDGIATIQSLYAPAFSANSGGEATTLLIRD